ncbi:pyridoxamine 5'-phosphate oxidase family protein [Streptomyces sp. NPDC057638]|uniref:pyridoxamine 5'-phosphate oxidase family protein n=1 Tax=Streptomyces sp. NPDC057638 TaxID=3346190 RepID=UPI0036D04192
MTAADSRPTVPSGPRGPRQRKDNTLERLVRDDHVWVATADATTGEPCLVPLSFWWDGRTVWLATRDTTPTGRNLRAPGRARLAFGHSRDVVLVHGSARRVPREELPATVGDAFAAKRGWDPRQDHPSYVFFQITPEVVRAWRTGSEMAGQTLMTGGQWRA